MIFVQLIFHGAGAMVDHISGLLDDAPVLVQYSDKGMQTGVTFKEAVMKLPEMLRKHHAHRPAATIKMIVEDGHRCITTDGAARIFWVEVVEEALKLKIKLVVREGGSSFITQMWDQIFYAFADEYVKLAMS